MSQRLRYTDLAPHGIAAMRSLEHYLNTGTCLDPVLLELVRLRASLLNGCAYCVGLHTHELSTHNETADRMSRVADWRTFDGYTQRERAALAWTEAVTNIQDGHASDAAYAAMRLHFTDEEVVNLTLSIASINAWNRMVIAFRAEHQPKPAAQPDSGSLAAETPHEENEHSAVDDDGGKVAVDD